MVDPPGGGGGPNNILDFNTAAPQLAVIDTAEWEQRLVRLRASLQQQAAEFVREIFPRARIQHHEARIGSLDGEQGESLSIALTGEAAGQWFDHATGEKGDLIRLYELTARVEFVQAVPQLEQWLGIAPGPKWRSPVKKLVEQRAAEAEREPRKDVALGVPVATWHYLGPDGRILALVRRYDLDAIDPDTGKRKKTFRPFIPGVGPGMPDPRPLYRLPQIRSADTVVFVEGEKCADALADVGIEATAIMGGSNTLIEKSDLTPLAGKNVILWPDNDGVGKNEATSHVGVKFMARLTEALAALGCNVSTIAIPEGKPRKWDAADAVAEGEDVVALIASATAAETPADTIADHRKLRILDIDDLASIRPPRWLVDGVLPEQAFAGLYGAPGAAKSFVALDLGLCVATGHAWHGREVRQGYVLYVAGEGQSGMQARILGWRDARGEGVKPAFGLVPQAVAMPTAQLDELLVLIRTLPTSPVLIILDTLARTFGQGDENNQKDMNAYVAAVDRLRIETGAAVLVLHHTGKDEARGLRGSSALAGAVDTSIYVRRKNSAVTLVNKAPFGKQKDAEEFEDISLVSRKIEFERAGERATTLILTLDTNPVADGENADERAASQENGPAQARGKNQQAIVRHLKKAGRPLGLTSLTGLIGKDSDTTRKAVEAMVEKGVIRQEGNGYVLV